MSKSSNVVAGFITGATLAGVAVLLTTPASGKEMRQKAKDTWENFDQISAELRANICHLIENIKETAIISMEKIGPFIADVGKAIDKWNEAIEPHQTEIKRQIEELEDNLERLENMLSKN